MGVPGANHQYTNVGEPLGSEEWWNDQRKADDKFQDALRAAGVKEGVDTKPGTRNPKFMRPQADVQSLQNLVYPTAPVW